MVQGHAGEQTKNQKVKATSAGEAKEVDESAKRHETSLRRAETAGRQKGRDAARSKRPIEGRSISGGVDRLLSRKGDTWYLCSF
jgi:hypothetical protein